MGATNVTAGKPAVSGAIYRALLSSGLTLPTDATTAMSTLTDFKSLGYVSDAGLTNSNSPEASNIKAWGGDTVLSIQTAKEDSFSFTLLETLDAEVLKAVYGSGNVAVESSTGAITITANSDEQEEAAWVIDMAVRGGKKKRIVIPNAKITSVGDIAYADESAVGYELTITAIPDATGNTHYEYIA